ncbi:MAG: hemolysin family protein [Spirochaetia bacterium]|nr:hemolysin family protein [Spirochaetia bacterium]
MFNLKSRKAKEEKNEVLAQQEQHMIEGVTELSETAVKEVLVPRIDVVFIPAVATLDEVLKIIERDGYSRYPVYEETIDNVIGVLYVKDLISVLLNRESSEFDLKKLIRKPYFIPESKRLDSLLSEFKKRHVHIAIAVDEYGGVSGIVCMEDIIEEIVGEIQDEFDDEGDEVIQADDHSWLVDARINIEDLNEKLNLQLPDEDVDTLGGFVFNLFGKIPVRYEKVSYENLDFIIQEIENHKIKIVKIVSNGQQEK